MTQGIVPSRRYRPGVISAAFTGCAPSRREVVRCEIPTVVNALPWPIAVSQRAATSFSDAAWSRRTPASCWERMKTAVRLPPASCA